MEEEKTKMDQRLDAVEEDIHSFIKEENNNHNQEDFKPNSKDTDFQEDIQEYSEIDIDIQEEIHDDPVRKDNEK